MDKCTSFCLEHQFKEVGIKILKNKIKEKKKKTLVYLPFIQFFSGWKWKAVLCQENIAFVQLYESSLPEKDGSDLAETPCATPLGIGPEMLEKDVALDANAVGASSSFPGLGKESSSWLWSRINATNARRIMTEAMIPAKPFKVLRGLAGEEWLPGKRV